MKRSDHAYHNMTSDQLLVARKKLSMTQDEMAELLGVSKRMYCYYEDGASPIPKAAGMVVESMLDGNVLNVQGTLTSYDDHRIRVLSDSMHQYANTVDLDDATTRRVLHQAVREIDLLLSKFE